MSVRDSGYPRSMPRPDRDPCIGCGGEVTIRGSVCATCRAEEISSGRKRCRVCFVVKDRGEFYELRPATVATDGLSAYCRDCNIVKAKTSQDRFNADVRVLNHRHRHDSPDEKGECRAFLNLGSWTQRLRVRCSNAAVIGGYCLRHVSSRDRVVGRKLMAVQRGQAAFGSSGFVGRLKQEREAELSAWLAANVSADALIQEQAKDARFGDYIGRRPWLLSLDAPLAQDDETRMDYVTDGDEDTAPGVIFEKRWHGRLGRDAWWVEPLIDRIDFWREVDEAAREYELERVA